MRKQSHDSFQQAIGRQSGDAAETPDGYELRGEFAWMDEERELASLWVELREGGWPIARDRIRLKRDWIPHTIAGGKALRRRGPGHTVRQPA